MDDELVELKYDKEQGLLVNVGSGYAVIADIRTHSGLPADVATEIAQVVTWERQKTLALKLYDSPSELEEWRSEVSSHNTKRGYDDWLAHKWFEEE